MIAKINNNLIKNVLKNKKNIFGIYICIPSPMIVELAGYVGFDFVRIDICHISADMQTIVNMIRAAEASGLIPMVRIDYDPVLIAKILEAGAKGIFIPDVCSYEMAKSVIDSVYFSPIGDRGTFGCARICQYGEISTDVYTQWSNDEILLGIQIESKKAVENLDKILGLNAIDIIGSGRGDLANALGYTGKKDHPSVLALEEKIFDAALRAGKIISVNLDPSAENFNEELVKWKSKAQVITLGHDINLVRKNFAKALDNAR